MAAGLGMKSGGSNPLLDAACHNPISLANTIHGTSAASARSRRLGRGPCRRSTVRSGLPLLGASTHRHWRDFCHCGVSVPLATGATPTSSKVYGDFLV